VNFPAVYEHVFVIVVGGGGFEYIVETISKTISYKKNWQKTKIHNFFFFFFYNLPFISYGGHFFSYGGHFTNISIGVKYMYMMELWYIDRQLNKQFRLDRKGILCITDLVRNVITFNL